MLLVTLIINNYWTWWYPEYSRSRKMLSAEPKAEVDNTYKYQHYSAYHKNRILKEIHTVWCCSWISCIARATYRLVKKSCIKRLIQPNVTLILTTFVIGPQTLTNCNCFSKSAGRGTFPMEYLKKQPFASGNRIIVKFCSKVKPIRSKDQ